ncbi:MAG: hypothetical protein IT358_07065, partial [Gemmatimonadaceae bacterium]|nr:hypothetical protein [Gemmatimonadaceae bacterium]
MTAINPEARSFIDPRRLLRSIYMGRLAMTAAIYLAAVFAWRDADRGDTLVASLTITVAMIFTAGS